MSNLKTRLHWKAERWPWWLNLPWHPIVCFVCGHTPVRDQCNKPEHDYCGWCGKSMPDQAPIAAS